MPRKILLSLCITLFMNISVGVQARYGIDVENRPVPGFLSGFQIGADAVPEATSMIEVRCGELGSAIEEAKILAQGGQNVKVTLAPCVYREQLILVGIRSGSIEVVAEVPGTAIISGSDIFTGWVESGGVWSTDWIYDFGLKWPASWPNSLPQDEILKRSETFFLNGVRLTQVSSLNELFYGSFFIDELQNKVFIKTKYDLNSSFWNRTPHVVEGTVRQTVVKVSDSDNIFLSGVVVQHAASSVQVPAMLVQGSSNILMEEVTVRDNSGSGLGVETSDFVTTRRVRFIDNGYTGYNAWRVTGLLSEDDTVVGSNWRGFPLGYLGWSVSGFKHMSVHNAIYRRLITVKNRTRGFWLDFDIKNIVIDDGLLCDNTTEGASLEAVQGPILIRGITVCNNLSGGIRVTASDNIIIAYSRFENNGGNHLNFIGAETRNATDFETGEQMIIRTDNWEVKNTRFVAVGDQVIVGVIFGTADNLPPNIINIGNFCASNTPSSLDALVCPCSGVLYQ